MSRVSVFKGIFLTIKVSVRTYEVGSCLALTLKELFRLADKLLSKK